jgi:hypothetical protein
MASLVPSRTISALTQRFSIGQIASLSQLSSGMSSATPLSRVIAACVCAFTKPGNSR